MRNSAEYQREYMKKYQEKVKRCETCDCDVKATGWYQHVKTTKHKSGKKKTEAQLLDEADTKAQLKEMNELIYRLYSEIKKDKST